MSVLWVGVGVVGRRGVTIPELLMIEATSIKIPSHEASDLDTSVKEPASHELLSGTREYPNAVGIKYTIILSGNVKTMPNK